MTPQRRRFSSAARTARVAERTHAQQARLYAEQWYQALLAWHLEHSRVPVPSLNYHAERAHFYGHDRLSTLGEFLPSRPSMLNLPHGQVPEGEVGQLITRMMGSRAFETAENGHLLDALRDPTQRKPATLLRENGGWQPDAGRHAAWALAVLSLAVALYDTQAGQYLAYCRRVMDRPDPDAVAL